MLATPVFLSGIKDNAAVKQVRFCLKSVFILDRKENNSVSDPVSAANEAEVFERSRFAPILTVQQHVLREQQRVPGMPGEFSWLMSGLTLATKMIAARVRRAGLTDTIGAVGSINVQGEEQQKLDVYANETLLHCLSWRETIGLVASEENEKPVAIHFGSPHAKY